MKYRRHLVGLLALVVGLTVVPVAGNAADIVLHPSGVLMPQKVGISPALRDLPTIDTWAEPSKAEPRELNERNAELPSALLTAHGPTRQVDTRLQDRQGPLALPAPVIDFEGVGNVNGVLPPDTNGDVGIDHYVQWVNLSYAVFNKSDGTVAAGPYNGNALWTGFGGDCENHNDGDPIVLYDQQAGRWFMSQFTTTNHQCIAVSTSGDPTGTWYLYDYLMDAGNGYFPDYPKFGVWPDGYYYSANMFTNSYQGAMAAVFERSKMLTGDPAQMVYFFSNASNPWAWSLLPADWDGLNPPGTGAPNPFITLMDDSWGESAPYDKDELLLFEFHVDWTTPANSTFTGPSILDLSSSAPFDTDLCAYARSCIPQPGTTQGLDALSSRLMYRLQYRNFGDRETLVVSHTVDSDGSDHAGVRWYELRDTGSGWTLYQAGTYAPDSDHRWMGDVAMDASGNILVGYSVSSSTTYPSIRWAGRLAGDPLGQLAQGESEVIAGSGSQTHSAARWGDYASMSVDPADDCTFWFTTEYMPSTGSAPWQTRIGALKFPACTTGPSGTISGVVTDSGTGDPIEGAQVLATDGSTTISTLTAADGSYSLTVPVGTYSLTASAFGYTPGSVTGITVNDGDAIVQDFALAALPSTVVTGTVTDAGHGWPLYARIDVVFNASTVATVYTSPFDGTYSVELPDGGPYEFTATSMIDGYETATQTGIIVTSGLVVDFQLAAISPDCTAPGYGIPGSYAMFEDFEGSFPPAGWTVVDNGGDCTWESTATTGRTNSTGGTGDAADADSDHCGSGSTMDTDLLSPAVDVSAFTQVTVEFKYDFNDYGGNDYGSVDISADGGSTWTHLIEWDGVDDRGPKTFSQDVTSIVSGSTSVVLRFHYDAPGWDWYFLVDDVRIYDSAGDTECTPFPGGLVEGFVTDAVTLDGINGATVTSDAGTSATTQGTPDDPGIGEGYYWLFTPTSGGTTHDFTASATNYSDETVTADVVPDDVIQVDFALASGWLEVTPTHMEARLYPGETDDQTLTLLNYGGAVANFRLVAVEQAGWVPSLPMDEVQDSAVPADNQNDMNARAATAPAPERGAPLAAGDVISSWAPGITFGWGLGVNQYADTIWVGNPGAGGGDDLDYEFTRTGTQTGLTVDTSSWMGSWAADMAFDPTTGMMWQVAVGGDNCIHEWNPSTGTNTGNSICWGASVSERGLAYDPISDTFFVGGWNTNAVTRFDRDGTVLQVANVNIGIAGLAYNPLTEHLFVMENSPTDTVTVLDVADNYNVVGTFTIAGFGNYAGSGLGFTCDGHLWAMNQVAQTVNEVDSGETGACLSGSLPWYVLTPDMGTVPAGTIDTPGQTDVNTQFIADGAPHWGLVQGKVVIIHDTAFPVDDVTLCLTKAFTDIPVGYWADTFIHALAGARISSGCGATTFCPSDVMTRGIMARWLIRAMHGPNYSPPPCTSIFTDVICETTPNADYIEALYNEGVTAGCATDPLRFCPDNPVTRAQMAVFLLAAKEGTGYTPPACTGIFTDVPCPAHWAADWVEELFNRGITAGCGTDIYCPDNNTTRSQMSVFMTVNWDFPTCNVD